MNEDYLDLPYEIFDQTPGKGWRKQGENLGCYLKAAKMIDEYAAANQHRLTEDQHRILKWHAGQMYAFADRYGLARERFSRSLWLHEPKDTPVLWNDYVLATIAFLDRDFPELVNCRQKISEGQKMDGRIPNLDVVDGLIRCFDRSYKEAYSTCR